jgi:hypothetical protein
MRKLRREKVLTKAVICPVTNCHIRPQKSAAFPVLCAQPAMHGYDFLTLGALDFKLLAMPESKPKIIEIRLW